MWYLLTFIKKNTYRTKLKHYDKSTKFRYIIHIQTHAGLHSAHGHNQHNIVLVIWHAFIVLFADFLDYAKLARAEESDAEDSGTIILF